MRCPHCQATNPDSASFCGLCYTRFDDRDHPVEPQSQQPAMASDPDVEAAPAPAPSLASSPTPSPASETSVSGRFAAVGGTLTWRCALCDTANDVQDFTCSVCGARMDAEVGHATDVDWPAARQAEVLCPGLGHLKAGHTGIGAARTGIAALWLVGALLLILGGGAGVVTALPLLVGVAIVWATGPGDLDAVRTDRPPRLDARGFMYLVTGVTLGVIVFGGASFLL